MSPRYSVASMVLLAMCVGLGCSKERTLEGPPKPGKDAQVVYHSARTRTGDYTLSPAERDAMVAIVQGDPDVRFVDSPVVPAVPIGQLHIGGQYHYSVDWAQISVVVHMRGKKHSGYCWRGDRVGALAKRLYEARAENDIRDAFAEFAKAQTGEAGTRPTQPD